MFIRGQNYRHKEGKTLQLSIHTVCDRFVLFLTVIKDNTDGEVRITLIK